MENQYIVLSVIQKLVNRVGPISTRCATLSNPLVPLSIEVTITLLLREGDAWLKFCQNRALRVSSIRIVRFTDYAQCRIAFSTTVLIKIFKGLG